MSSIFVGFASFVPVAECQILFFLMTWTLLGACSSIKIVIDSGRGFWIFLTKETIVFPLTYFMIDNSVSGHFSE